MAENVERGPALSVRQAAFIGVGSMVGAGIFALLGAAGEVAGAAVWISFLLAGGVAALQGYSFARLGARYPSAGGFLEYVMRDWGDGHLTGVIALDAPRGQRDHHRDGGGLLRQSARSMRVSTRREGRPPIGRTPLSGTAI